MRFPIVAALALVSSSIWCAAADGEAPKEAFEKRYEALNKALQTDVQKDAARAYRDFDSNVRKLLS